jgi:tripartite-type tricarboxylate transporter receptor subunit TctC
MTLRLLQAALGRAVCALLFAFVSLAYAQGDYPSRPIRFIVGYAPGGSTDVASRIVAEKLALSLGQPVVVENRAGAGGMIAAQAVIRSAPDGYTLMAFNPELAGVVPAVQKTPPYDPLRDFAYVGTMYSNPGWTIAVNPSLPVKTLDELVKYAKTSRSPLNYGTYGVGSLPHLNFEALKARLGIDMAHVPYKGGALSYQAAMAGEVQVVAGTSFFELIKAGRLRPLAIGGAARTAHVPGMPTLAELGLGDEIFGEVYAGIAVPAGTPRPIIDRLSAELKRILSMPDVMEKFLRLGEAKFVTPEQFTAMVRRDFVRYGPLVRSLGLDNE